MVGNWKTSLLLSIILPISLFVSLRMTGILSGPVAVSQTITATTLHWNMSRPMKYGIINEEIIDLYSDKNVSINLTLLVASYHENEPGAPSNGRDYVKVEVVIMANISKGFTHSISAGFSEMNEYATAFTSESCVYRAENLRVERIQNWGTGERATSLEATPVDSRKSWGIYISFAWIFFDSNDEDHSAVVRLELLHYDGVAFREISMPIELKVLTP